jgi:sporulation protein YlmC with PRC-barrel domain
MIQISRIIAKRFSNQGPRKDQHRLRTTGSRSSIASKIARRACLLWAACCCVNVMPAAAAAAPAPNAALSQSMPLQELLWREVKTTDGQSVGTVSDVLCHLPSGQIAYVAIDPSDLYERPRVVAPETLSVPADRNQPVQVKMTINEWLNSPRLDWSGLEVTQRSDSGENIKGVYQKEWVPPRPTSIATKKTPAEISAALPASSGPSFVALSRFHLKRVSVPGWDSEGFLNGFLLDWKAKRVTHALVSTEFAPISGPEKPWYAFPVALLTPPNDQEFIGVNTNEQAVASAQRVPGGLLRSDLQSIYQFSPKLLSNYASAAE